MVTVNAEVSTVQTSASVATVIDRQFVSNLPLNGRSFQSLISLTPGTTLTAANTLSPGQFSVNGQRSNSNYFTVDGVSANIGVSLVDAIGQQAAGSVPGLTATGSTINLVSIDALEEFKIQTSTFAPEFGRTPGAQVSLLTRSGSNDFHGSAFEYFRNDVFDANDWFANRAGQKRPALRQNQFGSTFSGPVTLPRFGEGGDGYLTRLKQTFFFFSYEGLRLRQPTAVFTTVFSDRIRNNAPEVLRPILRAFPAPAGPEIGTSGFSPFTGSYSNPSTADATSVRVDHVFSDRVTAFGRFNYSPSETATRSTTLPSLIFSQAVDTLTVTGGITSSFSANVSNDLRFNYSRTSSETARTLDDFGGAEPFPFRSYLPPNSPERSVFGFFVGPKSLLVGPLNANEQRQINLVDNLSVIRGQHELKFGLDYRRLSPVFQSRDFQIFYIFLNPNEVLTGRPFFSGVNGLDRTLPVFHNYSLYAQDTWRASPRTTLTYGLRWDVNPPPTEAGGRHPFVLNGPENPETATLAPPGTPLWKTTYNNFAPRFGLSYALAQKPGRETTLRGGFGLFFDLGSGIGADAFTRAPFLKSAPLVFGAPFPLPLELAAVPPTPTDARGNFIVTFVRNIKLPRTWQWNLTAEQSLGKNQTFSAAYVGAAGRRLLRNRFVVPTNQGTILSANLIDNGATSDYHAMQLQFDRRLSRGLQALVSYTWSHSIDEVSSDVNSDVIRRGDSDFDVRHNLSAAATYDLPDPSGHFAHALFGGWALDAIIHAQSSAPVNVIAQNFVLINGQQVSTLPNVVPDAPLYVSDPAAPGGRRINRGAFAQPPVGTQGNLGRNSLRAFPLHQLDLALRRRFNLTESAYVQVKAEAFNALNHPNFAPPVADLNDPLFGQSTGMFGRSLGGLSPIYQIGGPRSLQLALTLGF